MVGLSREERTCWEELAVLFSPDIDCTEDRSLGAAQTLPQRAVGGLGMASRVGALESVFTSRS